MASDETPPNLSSSLSNDPDHSLDSRSEENLVMKFIGTDSDKFSEIYRRSYGPKDAVEKKWSFGSFNIAAFFVPIVWFFYRKMYLYGAAVILIPVVIFTLFPDFADKISMGVAGVFAVLASPLYVGFVRRKVLKIEKLAIPEEEKDELINSQGGVSVPGAILGGAITLAGFSLAILPLFAELPQCNDPVVAADVKNHIEKSREQRDAQAVDFEVDNFRPYQLEESKQRICEFDFTARGIEMPMYLGMKWEDKSLGTYNYAWSLNLDDILKKK